MTRIHPSPVAVEEQLGLQALASTRGPVDTLVIDHAGASLGELMFARRIRIERIDAAGAAHPCPIAHIDTFAMRNFTNDAAIFDDTLPIADGLLEAGHRVPLDRLRTAMQGLVAPQRLPTAGRAPPRSRDRRETTCYALGTPHLALAP